MRLAVNGLNAAGLVSSCHGVPWLSQFRVQRETMRESLKPFSWRGLGGVLEERWIELYKTGTILYRIFATIFSFSDLN